MSCAMLRFPDRFVSNAGPRTIRGASTCGAPLRLRVVRSIEDCI